MPTPQLDHVATISIGLAASHVIPSGPKGGRVIADVASARVEGTRLNASMVGAAGADWLTLGPDSTYGTLDVRMTLKTDDDAVIFIEYGGKIDVVAGRAISAPLFQTGDERYEWLNRSQFLADGTFDAVANTIVYELYQVVPS